MAILLIESNPADMLPDDISAGYTGSGAYRKVIKRFRPDVACRIRAPYEAPLLADDLHDIQGAMFAGSGVNWSTDAPQAKPLRDALALVFEHGVPVYGSCNGMQLAAVLLGGSVTESPEGPEVGIATDLRLTPEGKTHRMMAGRQDAFGVPCIHRDIVSDLPRGAVRMAGNRHTENQAFVYEQNGIFFWGTQYHPEMTAADVAWCIQASRNPDQVALLEDLQSAASDQQAAERLGTDVSELMPERRCAELVNWLAAVLD